MNNYSVTKCECGKVVITSEVGTIKVAGWQGLEHIITRLKAGESLDGVGKDYCSYCLFHKDFHSSKEIHALHPDWLPYHDFQPQSDLNRFA